MRVVFNKDEDKKLFIKRVKDIGESLIKNAESIVGSEEYIIGISIIANIDLDEVPSISISKDILPENSVNAEANNKTKFQYEGELKSSV